jgi:asparaginyl-tRNA synthetase
MARLASVSRSIRALLAGADSVAAPSTSVEVQGWVRALRTQKNVCFVSLNDGSQPAHLQVVCPPELVKDVSHGSSIQIKGTGLRLG